MKHTLTHKGWFGFCPVYFSKPYSNEPLVVERHPIFLPLFFASEMFLNFVFLCRTLINGYDDELGWPLKITGKIAPKDVEIAE